ncbi:MAG: RNA polymerase sigma factor [Bradymonadia bacterium]
MNVLIPWPTLLAVVFAAEGVEHPDFDLIRGALTGKRAAQKMLIRRLMPVICAHVRRALARQSGRMTAAEDGHDIVQEVWLVLMREDGAQLRNFDPRKASLEWYVGMVTDREIGNRLQKARAIKRGGDQKMTDIDDAHDLSAPNADPEKSAADRQMAARLSAHLMQTLPPKGQLVFRLLYIDGCEVQQAAELMGVNRQVVYNWQFKIRKLAQAFVAEAA